MYRLTQACIPYLRVVKKEIREIFFRSKLLSPLLWKTWEVHFWIKWFLHSFDEPNFHRWKYAKKRCLKQNKKRYFLNVSIMYRLNKYIPRVLYLHIPADIFKFGIQGNNLEENTNCEFWLRRFLKRILCIFVFYSFISNSFKFLFILYQSSNVGLFFCLLHYSLVKGDLRFENHFLILYFIW